MGIVCMAYKGNLLDNFCVFTICNAQYDIKVQGRLSLLIKETIITMANSMSFYSYAVGH